MDLASDYLKRFVTALASFGVAVGFFLSNFFFFKDSS